MSRIPLMFVGRNAWTRPTLRLDAARRRVTTLTAYTVDCSYQSPSFVASATWIRHMRKTNNTNIGCVLSLQKSSSRETALQLAQLDVTWPHIFQNSISELRCRAIQLHPSKSFIESSITSNRQVTTHIPSQSISYELLFCTPFHC